MSRPQLKTLKVLVAIAVITSIAMLGSLIKLISLPNDEVTRINYSTMTVDVTHSSYEARASISCAKATKMILVSNSEKSFLYCTPEDGNIILRSDEVDSIIVLGEPLGAYTELDIKESL